MVQGGFVGVDVFFVISGYLISGLILTELEQTGRFDAWDFYARRMKRLLPALFLMVGVTAWLSYQLDSPWWQPEEIASAKSAVLWWSNFYFADRNVDYFSPGLENFALLHTWSLGVEEQFYVVWPWLLLFLLAYWKWQAQKSLNKRRLAIGLVATWVVSMATNLFLTNTTIKAGFYLMPPRAWEFALGTLVFLYRRRLLEYPNAGLSRLLGRSVINLAGLALIVGSAFTYSANMVYPGLWALVPCLGSALVLLDRQNAPAVSILSRLLITRPLQYLGDISYSWYLWHWPILLLGMSTLGTNAWTRVGLLLIGLALGMVSYQWVERPLRRYKLTTPIHAWGITAAAMLMALLGLGEWQDLAVKKAESDPMTRLAVARGDLPSLYSMDCDTWFSSDKLSVCTFGDEKADKSVVVLGDSVLAMWFPALADIYVNRWGWKMIVLTKSSCALQDVPYFYPRINRIYTECSTWRHRALDYIAQSHPDLVITGGTKYGFTPEQWVRGTEDTVARLSQGSKHVLLFSPAPELGFDGPSCLAKMANQREWLELGSGCTSPENVREYDRIAGYLEQAAKRHDNVKLVRVDELVCPKQVCSAMRNDMVVYRDNKHMTAKFVKTLSHGLEQLIYGG